ncbi:MAG: hypothetical protein AAGF23_17110 [Acidobacteriota bacterium]
MTYSSGNRRDDPSLADLLARKEELAKLREGTVEYSEALAAYEDALSFAMYDRFEPLPRKYELSEKEMPPDYREFKKEFEEKGPHTFKDFFPTVTFAARAKITGVGWRAEAIRIRPLEVYKGALTDGQSIEMPRSWGTPHDWCRKGDEAVLFGDDSSGLFLAGRLGYLRLKQEDGDLVASSLLRYAPFWNGFDPVVDDDVCRISWPKLREYLLTH